MHVAYGHGSVLFVVIAIRYALQVLWMKLCFFYNGPYSGMNFATKDRYCINLLAYCEV